VFSLILADVITPGIAGHILMMIDHGIGYLFMGNPPSVHGILAGEGLWALQFGRWRTRHA
jgi:hypothetical protein